MAAALLTEFIAVAAMGMDSSAAAVARVPSSPPVEQCRLLRGADLSGIPDAPTQIIDTQIWKNEDERAQYCQVSGYISPTVGFLMRLPLSKWNHKLLQLGCSGHCGSTNHIDECDDGLRRGYACIVTDGGHHSSTTQALWAYNNWQGQIDYFVRASHVTALAAKTIVERYYGEQPAHSYFMGCSAGGREAMMQAQRFPWDFDGIIAGCPSLNQTGIRMNLLWNQRALMTADFKPLLTDGDIQTLHRAVVKKCDLNDGLEDGLIGDPRACTFNPGELLCSAARTRRCLTKEQVQGVEKVYRGPTTSAGEQIYPPGALRGSEKTWQQWFTSPAALALRDMVQDAFRYYAFHPNPGATWRLESFDFDHDYRRLALTEGLYAAINPDLRRFKAAGGKLLVHTGWNDAAGMALPVIDYYETAERTLGGRLTTQEFFRLFVLPGVGHCGGGDGAQAVDYLSYLERWVEYAEPPASLISFRTAPVSGSASRGTKGLRFALEPRAIEFARPVYPYPTLAKYRGRGDPRDASSFYPVETH